MTHSPKQCRSGDRCQPVTAREAWHCQLHHSATRIDDVARELGMLDTTLSAMVNPYGTGSMLPARHHAKALALTSDNLAVLRFYAAQQSAVVHRIPRESALVQVAEVVREFGEFLTKTAIAHDDGVVTADEATAIAREGEEAMAAIASVVEESRKRVSGAALRAVAK